MERREHYQPEDIESLLHERAYDELLEEERAFVLLHLSGKEEYEAMRSLLSRVREDDRRTPQLVADSAVREHVLTAFRAQQRPQWSIWLNSLGALLWPKEMSAMWRPALALASVALLIVAGVQVARFADKEATQPQLAELKAPADKDFEKNEAAGEATTGTLAQPAEPPKATIAEDLQAPPATRELLEVANAETEADRPLTADETVKFTPAQASTPAADAAGTVTGTFDMAVEKKAEFSASAPPPPVALGSTSHVVTTEELSGNMSVANTDVGSRQLFAQKQDARAVGNLAEEPALIALLNTGW